MPFLFVDHISKIDAKSISGHLKLDGDCKYINPEGFVLPGIISEAIGQLASWKVIHEGDYKARPVFLFADRIEILHPVRAGTKIELFAEIHHCDAETVAFSGGANIDCRKVLSVDNCTGYFMELDKLEDPSVTRQRFSALCDVNAPKMNRKSDYKLDDEIGRFEVLASASSMIEVSGHISESSSFYRDHFPKFPVTPIVVINELIGRICENILGDDEGQPTTVALKEVTGVKIREFLRPNEAFTIKAAIKERMRISPQREEAKVYVQILKDNKNILRGHYLFSVKNTRENPS